ncbi:hypothetical protein BU23DRAFT_562779 [Bimuria novae-zelandiae CBS 107.79]|uniref:Uncharacterized protein n=1 Tax=Bimuria novae-zelandiae CBS 107.79 TaxID=1447943 RepID=A0A6A5VV23_9PLEO|nr:hypothetical protein BU23DRAFT_562779 [Bimuria novae-zelandiae CBS 107.79]
MVRRSGGSSGARAITAAVPRRRSKRETRKVSTVISPVVLNLDSLSFPATPSSDTSSSFSSDSDLNLELCSGSETDVESQDTTYSEGRSDVDPNSDRELDVELDSKADVIMGTITYYTKQGHAMANGVLKDIRNIPDLGLDRSKKDKLAMYVQDLYAILHAL